MAAKKILIIKSSSWGDITQALSVLPLIKAYAKDSEIHWVLEEEYIPLLRAQPLIDFLIPIATRRWRHSLFSLKTWSEVKAARKQVRDNVYDLAFDLQGNTKSALVMACVRAKEKWGLAASEVREKINLLFCRHRGSAVNLSDTSEQGWIYQHLRSPIQAAFSGKKKLSLFAPLLATWDEEKKVETLLKEPCLKSKKCLLIAPFSRWPNKELPFESLVDFFDSLEPSFVCLLCCKGPREKRLAAEIVKKSSRKIVLIDSWTPPSLQLLMRKAYAFCGVDSFLLHLAAQADLPSFGFFGPSKGDCYAPEHKSFFQGACPYGISFPKYCPSLRSCSTGACLSKLSGRELAEIFSAWDHRREEKSTKSLT